MLVCCGAAMAGHIGYNRSISPRPSATLCYPTGPDWLHLWTRQGCCLGEGFALQDGVLIGNERWYTSLLTTLLFFSCAQDRKRRGCAVELEVDKCALELVSVEVILVLGMKGWLACLLALCAACVDSVLLPELSVLTKGGGMVGVDDRWWWLVTCACDG